MVNFTMQPIGIIYSPFQEKAETPIQPVRLQARGRVELYPEFTEDLQDVEGFSHLLDIKPYVPEDFDVRSGVHTGWYETRSIKE